MIGNRQGIVVWLQSLKQVKMLRRFGNVHYVSKRYKYAIIYCNMTDIEFVMSRLKTLSFVRKVEPSYKPFIKMEYDNAKPDKAKEYDYKMGL